MQGEGRVAPFPLSFPPPCPRSPSPCPYFFRAAFFSKNAIDGFYQVFRGEVVAETCDDLVVQVAGDLLEVYPIFSSQLFPEFLIFNQTYKSASHSASFR